MIQRKHNPAKRALRQNPRLDCSMWTAAANDYAADLPRLYSGRRRRAQSQGLGGRVGAFQATAAPNGDEVSLVWFTE
jgi:hypothetical protein